MFIVFLFVLVIIFIPVYLSFNQKVEYPPYYHDVEICYEHPGEDFQRYDRAWLSVNDNLELIWTLSETEVIIEDKYVLFWKEIE